MPAAVVCQIDSWGTLKVAQLNSPHSTQCGSVCDRCFCPNSFPSFAFLFPKALCARAPRQMTMSCLMSIRYGKRSIWCGRFVDSVTKSSTGGLGDTHRHRRESVTSGEKRVSHKRQNERCRIDCALLLHFPLSPKELYKLIWWCLYPFLQFDLQTDTLSSSLAAAPAEHDLIFERNVFVIILSLIPTCLNFAF